MRKCAEFWAIGFQINLMEISMIHEIITQHFGGVCMCVLL